MPTSDECAWLVELAVRVMKKRLEGQTYKTQRWLKDEGFAPSVIQESCSGDLVCRVMMMVTVVAMSVTIRQRGRGRCGRSHSGKLVNANRRNRDFLIQIWPF